MPVDRVALDLSKALKSAIKGEVRFDPYSRALYSTDASIYQMQPIGLVIPKDAADVLATVRLARDTNTPLLPRGGGTSLAGQCVNRAIVMDFSKYMANVLEVNEAERWARVQPGIAVDNLNAVLAPRGLMFAPDPSTTSRATVGGLIGNNSCGMRSPVYGKTVDNVLELTVILSDASTVTLQPLPPNALARRQSAPGLDGAVHREAVALAEQQRDELARCYPNIPRRVSGYNLDELLKSPVNMPGLLVGSEGTLATTIEAKIKLVPRPKNLVLGVLHFKTMFEAAEASVWLLSQGASAIELIGTEILTEAKLQLALSRRMGFLQGDPGAILVVEFMDDNPAELRARLDRLERDAARDRIGYACVKLEDRARQADVWAVRKSGLGLLMGITGDSKPIPFVEDTAVPPEKLADYVRRFDALVRQHGTTAAYYGHAGAGCLHIRPLINLKLENGPQRMAAIAEGVSDLVLEFGGSLSGEHGDGIVRGGFTQKMFGPRLYQAFRDLKRIFDPHNIMNPGKIVDTPPMTENLRTGPQTQMHSVTVGLDFSADGGFAGAIEQCNGQGECRKTGDGVMCPSFMVTREEEHSTRGRANALRSVLSGVLPSSDLTSKRLHDVLDLCVECKACKAECPSNVDMAKLKYEFLSHYHKAHGYSLRTRLFANIAALNRLGSATAPLSNWLLRAPPSKWAQGLLGISPKHTLPPFARQTFSAWFRQHTPPGLADLSPSPLRAGGGVVALFADTFVTYNYPTVAAAATTLIERAGYEVVVPERPCCGRPMLGKGMLDKARQHAKQNVEALYPLAAAGIPIVGLEPSCLLMLRDDYRDLLPGDEHARVVGEHAMLIDEFLAQMPQEAKSRLSFKRTSQQVLFHGHCHQKALVGTQASVAALRMVPGLDVRVIEAGCCGMAGSFGFEKEHYDISMKMAERRLLPTIRETPNAQVVVTGVSCRQQVEHGTGRRPLHLAEFLVEALLP
ncbi:MAG: FAD-binding oxidoreductase [Dehalococcoidia bacterium]|nr:FAD-binding oxidoreductase [Dehalococcoidia bacterium]